MSSHPPKLPLIAIVGATGTGKSQLAVSLAKRYDGEIINADALQMYEGLPIATNKISIAERRDIPHHLLGCVKLGEKPWTVSQFREKALNLCQDIRKRGRLPILVGGTHYYVQSLLFKESLIESADENLETDSPPTWPILEASTEDMLGELQKVDPAMARRWHPKDRRKIRRSLEIWLQSGIKASDLYEDQQQRRFGLAPGESRKAGINQAALSTSNEPLILWTYAPPSTLNPRLDLRVEKMIESGLYQEMKEMHAFVRIRKQAGCQIDQSCGIWVAIGYKECLPHMSSDCVSPELRAETVERIKISTRQYAKRQVRWIRLKLLPALQDSVQEQKMFLLDAANVSQWTSNVESAALNLLGSFLKGEELPKPTTLSSFAEEMLVTKQKAKRFAIHCDVCKKTLMSEEEWILHQKSKGHRSMTRPKRDFSVRSSDDMIK